MGRGVASFFFLSDYAPWAKTPKYTSREADFWIFELDTPRRLWTHSEKRMADSLGLSAKNVRKPQEDQNRTE